MTPAPRVTIAPARVVGVDTAVPPAVSARPARASTLDLSSIRRARGASLAPLDARPPAAPGPPQGDVPACHAHLRPPPHAPSRYAALFNAAYLFVLVASLRAPATLGRPRDLLLGRAWRASRSRPLQPCQALRHSGNLLPATPCHLPDDRRRPNVHSRPRDYERGCSLGQHRPGTVAVGALAGDGEEAIPARPRESTPRRESELPRADRSVHCARKDATSKWTLSRAGSLLDQPRREFLALSGGR